MNKVTVKSDYKPHPKFEGVYIKPFFTSQDNKVLSNMEVRIEPGFEISPHIHEKEAEFFYVVRGNGLFYSNKSWAPTREGEAMMAPAQVEHGVRNNSVLPLVLFCTFTPPLV